jgi:hypothetical protein
MRCRSRARAVASLRLRLVCEISVLHSEREPPHGCGGGGAYTARSEADARIAALRSEALGVCAENVSAEIFLAHSA